MSDQSSQDNQLPEKAGEGANVSAMPATENKTRSPDFFSRISITQLILVVLVIVFVWQLLDERRTIENMRQQLAVKIDEMEGASKSNRQLLAQSREQVGELTVKLAALESRYGELQTQRGLQDNSSGDISGSRDETALAEVEQMLLNAAQQLQLSANVRAALIFMQSADARLQRMNRPAYRGLGKIIARDMDKLRALPIVDVTGINHQLNNLMSVVDELPLAYQQRAANNLDTNAIPASDESTGQKLLREAWQELKQLVEIENTGRNEIPLLHPDQQFFLRENLKLRLLSARIALLSRDEVVFRQELNDIQLWIARYFDAKSPAVTDMLSGIKKLSASRIRVELPDLGSSLQAVRNYRLANEKTVR